MAGLLGLNDAQLLALLLHQQRMLGGVWPIQVQQRGWTFLNPPITQLPLKENDPDKPPPPERNPKRKQTEDEVNAAMSNQDYIDSLYLEGQNRLGHTAPMYPESEFGPDTYQLGKKRRGLKAI